MKTHFGAHLYQDGSTAWFGMSELIAIKSHRSLLAGSVLRYPGCVGQLGCCGRLNSRAVNLSLGRQQMGWNAQAAGPPGSTTRRAPANAGPRSVAGDSAAGPTASACRETSITTIPPLLYAMNTSRNLRLLVLAGTVASLTVGAAAPAPTPTSAPTLELPRLKRQGKAPPVAPLQRAKVTLDDLSIEGTADAKAARDQGLNYLAVDPGKQINRPLRGALNEVTFVSFFVYASVGSSIEVGGAQLSIVAGQKPGLAQLLLGPVTTAQASAHELACAVKLERHGNASLAPLPILTVRLDPVLETWDVFLFERLLLAGLPLDVSKREKKFTISAGSEGAWLLGLVSSDENPLFVDANGNGVEDVFERNKLGTLLGSNAAGPARSELQSAFQTSQRSVPLVSWNVRRVVPPK